MEERSKIDLGDLVIDDSYSNGNDRKLLLINPPSGFLIDQRVFLPLGLASIAAVARDNNYDVKMIDLADDDKYEASVAEEVKRNDYGAVGITATSPQFYYAYKILNAIKKINPSIGVIIGGSHSSMFSSLRKSLVQRFSAEGYFGLDLEERIKEEDLNFAPLEDFDVIANGEEKSIFAALNALKSGQKWVDGGVTENLDALPIPARELFDVKSYTFDSKGKSKFPIGGRASGSLISQRGCPYGCEFCCGRDSVMYRQVKLPGGTLRAHSPERILKELDDMNKGFGLTSFMFWDDEFNLHPKRTFELCEALSTRDYRFRGYVKADLLVKHPEIAEAMKKVGFSEVLSGIESGSNRILGRHINKKTSPELNYQAARILLENGIGFKALTMMGHPSETEADIMATRDWILKVGREFIDKLGERAFTFDITVFQPYAGCPIWDRAEKNRGEFSDQYNWVYTTKKAGEVIDPEYGGLYFNKVDFSTVHGFYKGVPGEYKAFIRTKNLSAERMVYLRDSIDREIRDKLGLKQLGRITFQDQIEHSMGQGATQSN